MFRKGQGIDKYDGKSVFKFNEGGKYKVEGWTNFVNLLSDGNQHKLFQLKHNFLIKTISKTLAMKQLMFTKEAHVIIHWHQLFCCIFLY